MHAYSMLYIFFTKLIINSMLVNINSYVYGLSANAIIISIFYLGVSPANVFAYVSIHGSVSFNCEYSKCP